LFFHKGKIVVEQKQDGSENYYLNCGSDDDDDDKNNILQYPWNATTGETNTMNGITTATNKQTNKQSTVLLHILF
jgi:hypothetical protein